MSYTERETQLMRLVHTLWAELERRSFHDDDLDDLDRRIREAGLAWALPSTPQHLDPDDWLTPDQIAHQLGYKATTVRVWGHRYQLRQINGRYRWGDIQDLQQQRARRRHSA